MTRITSLFALVLLSSINNSEVAIAQINNGQLSNGPAAPNFSIPPFSTAGSATSSSLSGGKNNYNSDFSSSPSSPIVAPTSTVGNTPSSLQGGSLSGGGSGYTAYGSTVNGNINNRSVGNRSFGQPVGSASKTSQSFNSPQSTNKGRN